MLEIIDYLLDINNNTILYAIPYYLQQIVSNVSPGYAAHYAVVCLLHRVCAGVLRMLLRTLCTGAYSALLRMLLCVQGTVVFGSAPHTTSLHGAVRPHLAIHTTLPYMPTYSYTAGYTGTHSHTTLRHVTAHAGTQHSPSCAYTQECRAA